MKPLLATILLALAGYWLWPTRHNFGPGPNETSPPSLTLSGEEVVPSQLPKQVAITPVSWVRGDYAIRAVATFTLDGVLLAKSYYSDELTSLTPMDYAVAWGSMADPAHRGKDVEISQFSRTYQYRYRTEKFPGNEVGDNTANLHIIPRDNEIFAQLKDLSKGQHFRMTGYLVDVRLPDGIVWKTSLRRDDKGAGACETLWVEALRAAAP